MAKKKKSYNDEFYNYLCDVTTVYLLALFALLPVIYHDHYYDIGDFKFSLFLWIHIIYIALAAVLLVPYLVKNFKRKTWGDITFKSFIKSLSIVDWFFLAYGIFSLISFLASEYNTWEFFGEPSDNPAWYGCNGWFMGFRAQLIFVIVYFLVSRFFADYAKKVFLYVALGAAAIVFFFAILHRIAIDPLGFYPNLTGEQKLLFVTTMGQATWYSSYMAVVLPLGVAVYYKAEILKERILSAVFMVLGYMSLFSQNSDSAYIALAASVTALFFIAFESNKGFMRFLECIFIMIASAKLMGLLMMVHPDPDYTMDAISEFVLQSPTTWILVILIAAIYAAFMKLSKDEKIDIAKLRIVRNIFTIIMLLVLPAWIVACVLTTNGALPQFADNTYLMFNRDWGNARGGTWMLTAKMYGSFPFLQKLFGCGADCYVNYAYDYLYDYAKEVWGENTIANAHNEWYNILVNGGLLGFVTYLGAFVSAFIYSYKNREKSVLVTAAYIATVSYIFHGLFCYQTCLNTPFMIAAIGVAACEIRRSKAKENA